jgi:hypothetical protein
MRASERACTTPPTVSRWTNPGVVRHAVGSRAALAFVEEQHCTFAVLVV